jgi:hypothetical protein
MLFADWLSITLCMSFKAVSCAALNCRVLSRDWRDGRADRSPEGLGRRGGWADWTLLLSLIKVQKEWEVARSDELLLCLDSKCSGQALLTRRCPV